MKTTPINVASVPQRSPFRYPGGKTWLVPCIRKWLKHVKPSTLVEPFAGGGIVALTAAFESLAGKVVMVERDENVAAVWKTTLGNHSDWLAEKIINFDISVESVREELAKKPTSVRQQAFQTILKNRTHHGGILAQGSSLIKQGENGKGIKSRWYAGTLAKRIREIHSVRDRVEFIEGDAFEVIAEYASDARAAFFVDPPYTASTKKAGKRLYKYNEIDHSRLFAELAGVRGDFLMTYDDDDAVRTLAEHYEMSSKLIPMKSRNHTRMMEMLIGRDLVWTTDIADKQLSLF